MVDSYDSIIEEIEKSEEQARQGQGEDVLYERIVSLDGLLLLLSLPFSVFGILIGRIGRKVWARPPLVGWGVCVAVNLALCWLADMPWFFLVLGVAGISSLLYVLRDREWLNLAVIGAGLLLGGALFALLQFQKEVPTGFYGGHIGEVNDLDISLDGKRLVSGGSDRKVVLWDVSTHKPVRTFAVHTKGVTKVAVFPNGARALSASWDKSVAVYDLAAGKVLWRAEQEDDVSAAAVSPEGDLVLAGHKGGRIHVYDGAGKERASVLAHGERVTAIAVSPDGELFLSTGSDNQIKVWNLSDLRPVESLEWPGKTISVAVFSPDGRLALTGDQGGKIALWDTSTWHSKMGIEIAGRITDACFSPDGKRILITVSTPGTVTILDAETGAVIQTVSEPALQANALAVSLDRQYFFVAFSAEIRQLPMPKE